MRLINNKKQLRVMSLAASLLVSTSASAQQPVPQPPAPVPAAPVVTPSTAPPASPSPAAQTAPAPAPAAQQATTPPAPKSDAQLPPVDVIQKKAEPKPEPKSAPKVVKKPAPKPVQQAEPEPIAKPKPKPVKKAAAPKPKPQPQPAAAPEPELPPAEPTPQELSANPVYGAPGGSGAAQRAQQAAQTPVNPSSIAPANLEGFASSATNVTPEKLTEQQPRNINEVFTRVPGMIVINDDASGHHGGLALRGAPARRSRKLLVMEDGHPVNLALWLDPSVHFFAPADRVDSIEVLRGTVVTHGPNNNFGVVNVRNLSPFGANETVLSSAIGFTRNEAGFFIERDVDDVDGGGEEVRRGKSKTDLSARWHVHTRQTSGNVGVVLSYTGENVQGTWDTERLRFNDFYGAIGWKGVDQDLVVSVTHTRQRDNYDELNLTGQEEEEGGANGAVEAAFFNVKHCKTCYAPASEIDKYFGEVWRAQIVHNAYLDKNTTVTSRLYMGQHSRDRYQLISAEAAPDGVGDPPVAPVIVPVLPGEDDEGGIFFGEDTMFGRLRTFRHIGAEMRAEWANRPFLAGMTQSIQAGLRYEYQDMTNRNFLGLEGEVLSDGDKEGATIFNRSLSANTVSAFLQTSIKVARDFSVVPGVRLEWYKVNRKNGVIAGEESEAEEFEEGNCPVGGFEDNNCLGIEGIIFDPEVKRQSTSSFNALPGISFAYTGFHKTTIFGGYHRGLSTAVLRNEDFPSPDEIGDNFEVGLRTAALRGLQLEIVGFHQRLQDYQFGSSFSDGADRVFGRADRVEINGFEVAGRLNSHPFTGGDYNLFGEANYTYANGKFKKGSKLVEDDDDPGEFDVVDFAGNRIPEVPMHVAALTLGIERKTGWKWDASVTWTYRGAFFTDEDNTPFGGDAEGENGEVPGVWLLSARANLKIGDTGASIFVAGDNLLDKLYISDREDGLKPGQGRTIWTGFKYKF